MKPLHFSLPLPHSRFISRSRFLTPASEAAARKEVRGKSSAAADFGIVRSGWHADYWKRQMHNDGE